MSREIGPCWRCDSERECTDCWGDGLQPEWDFDDECEYYVTCEACDGDGKCPECKNWHLALPRPSPNDKSPEPGEPPTG